MRKFLWSSGLVVALSMGGCFDREEELSREEAEDAVEAANLSSSAQALTYDVIEVSTNFTIGNAVRDAASELRAFLSSQSNCAEITSDGATVTIDFGGLEDNCQFHGRTYGGLAKITLVHTAEKELEVLHEWQDLTNGKITLNGTARVTWNGLARSRRVEHDVDWTDKKHPEPLHSEGDRTQRLIDPELGVAGGVLIDGTRDWQTREDKNWHLDIEGVQVRGQDPVPQAGTYVLTTPKDKTLTMSFERVGTTKIRVTVTGAKGRSFAVDVLSVETP